MGLLRETILKTEIYIKQASNNGQDHLKENYYRQYCLGRALNVTLMQNFSRNIRGKKGINFPLIKHAGRDLCTAQLMVEQFDKQYNTPDKQLEFVAFLDYNPETGEIVEATLADFRKSWTRPKWSVILE